MSEDIWERRRVCGSIASVEWPEDELDWNGDLMETRSPGELME